MNSIPKGGTLQSNSQQWNKKKKKPCFHCRHFDPYPLSFRKYCAQHNLHLQSNPYPIFVIYSFSSLSLVPLFSTFCPFFSIPSSFLIAAHHSHWLLALALALVLALDLGFSPLAFGFVPASRTERDIHSRTRAGAGEGMGSEGREGGRGWKTHITFSSSFFSLFFFSFPTFSFLCDVSHVWL